MSLTENEYDALLAWYKKSGIAESTKPLIEYVRWVTPSLSEANTNNIPTPSNNIQFRSVPIATKETLYPKNSDRVPDIDGQENASRLEFEDEQVREPHAKLESTTSSSYPVGLHNLSPLPSIAHESIRSEDISRSTISVNCSVPLHAPTAVYKIPKAFYEWGSTADSRELS
ncbi:hypothetical protein C8J55DRAFT_563583 [Lentinula edodes]|uniref:Uncharacterized protein n=1 Tax=Lentinula lateritia TaxID=40482 RepID=A0A9W9A163_9AGAR|nr:hypothetical protein C8J55DRAFT_563583 [Lentinula edodes]